MHFQEYYRAKQSLIERYLDGSFRNAPDPLASYYEMLRYPLLAGGKRLRPVLTLMVNEMLGGDETNALEAAAALELIHTYSLVHDDLPAMDDDDLRRGKPTMHVVHGEANAILAGDALLTHAFTLIANAPLPPAAVVGIVREVSVASGISGMVGGQFLDLENEGKDIPFETLRTIHECKTGALIRAAVRVGGIIGNADERTFDALTAYGEAIGLAFQIQDDILDVTSDNATLGKNVGSDVKNNKATYVKFFGIEGAQRKAAEAVAKAVDALSSFKSSGYLSALARYIIDRKS
ncbi:MAG: polyprenyl synthetase family protein [Spirochaetes bacterium]|nr:polyprenyl synthetase family protein [Spirochaetota bacterium]